MCVFREHLTLIVLVRAGLRLGYSDQQPLTPLVVKIADIESYTPLIALPCLMQEISPQTYMLVYMEQRKTNKLRLEFSRLDEVRAGQDRSRAEPPFSYVLFLLLLYCFFMDV